MIPDDWKTHSVVSSNPALTELHREICLSYLSGMPRKEFMNFYSLEFATSNITEKAVDQAIDFIDESAQYALYTGDLRTIHRGQEEDSIDNHIDLPVIRPSAQVLKKDPGLADTLTPYRFQYSNDPVVVAEGGDFKVLTRQEYEKHAWDAWAQRVYAASFKSRPIDDPVRQEMRDYLDCAANFYSKLDLLLAMHVNGAAFESIAQKTGFSKELVAGLAGHSMYSKEWVSRFRPSHLLTSLRFAAVDFKDGRNVELKDEPALVETLASAEGHFAEIFHLSREFFDNPAGGKYSFALTHCNPGGDVHTDYELQTRPISAQLFRGKVGFLKYEGHPVRDDLLKLV